MNRNSTKLMLNTSVATLLVGSAFACLAPATAQTKPAPAAKDDTLEQIVVTGSLLKRPDLEGAAPVALVTAEDIKLTGNTRVEDILNSLPQVFAAQGANLSNGATGTATVSLRGLGSSRTLVLVDGKRLMPGDLNNSAADLNFIPAALVNRIDVLTGGASTTYGADAVAGVVNFVMNRKFEGVRVDANYGFYQHNNNNPIRDIVDSSIQGIKAPRGSTVDGGGYDLTGIVGVGTEDGKGHVVVYAGLRHNDAVRQDARDYSVCTLNPDAAPALVACGGSNLAPNIVRLRGLSAANRALAGVSALGSNLTIDGTNNGIKAYRLGVDAYNFAPNNFYLRDGTRYTAGYFASYEINEHAQVYSDFMFMNNRTKAQIAPSGLFSGVGGNGWTVNCDNPFLNSGPTVNIGTAAAPILRAQKAVAVCGTNAGVAGTERLNVGIGLRNTAGGPRFDDKGFSSFRMLVGVRGEINTDWNYDVSASFGRVEYTAVYNNDVSNTKIQRALQVVTDPATGLATCKSVLDGSDLLCKPYNVFEVGKITKEALNYIAIPLFETGRTTEKIVNATVTGNVAAFKSPLADEGLGIALGTEYREEALVDEVDNAYLTGEGAGTGEKRPVSGAFNVIEAFTEASIPLVNDKPGFHKLDLSGGYRYSSYKNSDGKKTTSQTFKGELTWQPIEDITLRASFNRAVRAPNIIDLFQSNTLGLWSGVDGCAGSVVGGKANGGTGFTLAQCANSGVTAAQFGNIDSNVGADQYNSKVGGATTLKPEKANTFTLGAVITPKTLLPGFSATIDYFSIKIKDQIGTYGGAYILDTCSTTGSAAFCSLVFRSKSTLSPGALFGDDQAFIVDTNVNTGSSTVRGIDASMNYKFEVANGHELGLDVTGTYLTKWNVQTLTGGSSYDCIGFHGTVCGTPTPKWRHRARLSYYAPSTFSASLTWRYLAGVRAGASDTFVKGTPFIKYTDINAFNYVDVALSASVSDKMKFRVGINNVLDKDPPILNSGSTGGGSNGNTYAQVYDTLGRYVFVNATIDF
jgi:iron complex outermembrane recepter protein